VIFQNGFPYSIGMLICIVIFLEPGYFTAQLHALTDAFPDEPKKLITLKATLRKNIPNYLTGLKDASIPLTNNRAERDIRHVVLKRNVSFGSRNAKGAEHTGILLSCLMSRRGRGRCRSTCWGCERLLPQLLTFLEDVSENRYFRTYFCADQIGHLVAGRIGTSTRRDCSAF